MVLGDNNAGFISYGTSIVSFTVPSLQPLWTYYQPSGGLSLVVSSQGGGVVAKDSLNGTDTVVRLDSSGGATIDSWTASNVINFGGNFWSGTEDGGGVIAEFSANGTEVADAWWVATDGQGGHSSKSVYTFQNQSQDNPNQAVIQGVLNELFTALPLANVPGASSCKNWLATGQNSLDDLHTVAPNIWFHATAYNKGRPDYWTEAVTHLGDGTPANMQTIVNDVSAFFNAEHPVFGGTEAYQGLTPRGYAGNEFLEQAQVVLHELAHQTAYPQPPPSKPRWKWQQYDGGNGGRFSISNDETLDNVCGEMIRALPSVDMPTDLPAGFLPGVSPTAGGIGSTVTIEGRNFGSAQNGSTVTFGGPGGVQATTILSWKDYEIKVLVPAGAQSGNVVVTVGGVPATGPSFTV